tara:strand:- start:72814 stop:74778 length:1965 start_codon:yes stop_codon:yes gene_type:complete
LYYKAAVNTPFNRSILTYESELELKKGDLVYAPLGKRKEKACILEVDASEELDKSKIKKITEKYELDGFLIPEELSYLQWVSKYYHYPLGQLIFDILPKPLKRPRNVEFLEGTESGREFILTSDQQTVWESVEPKLNGFDKLLIHGVTGSGKSIVYLKAIQEKINEGSVLYLLPEINLTPQFINFFKEHLKIKIFTYNSTVSNSEKLSLWNILKEGHENVLIIGVRSSVFLPIKNLSLVIVDEEHDSSFKQDDRCPYNARDIAIKKAHQYDVPIILGSATPSIETFYKYKSTDNYLPMRNRANKSELPNIKLISTRDDSNNNEIWPFIDETIKLIRERILKNEQVLIFVNRLGFASFVQCKSCGNEYHCPNCSTVLKYYKKRNSLQCQFCDYSEVFPEECDKCGNMKLLQMGYGTEKLEEVLRKIFPEVTMTRFDRDNVKTMTKLEEILNDFHAKKYQLLIGTQMLSKGHNFESVNCVVILGVDNQLNFPDFRSSERVYQLVTQVSGRSGRYSNEGEVIIQTMNPENELFEHIKNHSFDEFYEKELELRDICNFPPFTNLVIIHLTSKFQNIVTSESIKLKQFCESVAKHFSEVDIQGPRPAIIEKRANKFTWSLLLRSKNINDLHNLVSSIQDNLNWHYSISIKVDIDPQNIL